MPLIAPNRSVCSSSALTESMLLAIIGGAFGLLMAAKLLVCRFIPAISVAANVRPQTLSDIAA